MRSKTYYAYIRVSTTRQGEEGASLDAQRSAIQRYAVKNNLAISEWFEEQVTAAKRGRPVFRSMLKRLKAGKAKGILVHKIDRSARNLHDWASFVELTEAGIEIHLCHEQIDLSSRSGRLSADIQAVVAADYVRNLREESRKGMRQRLEQGIWPWAAPVGYLNQGGGRPKVIDPVKGPKVKRLFDLYATGDFTIRQLVTEAERMGLTNSKGGAMGVNRIAWMLANPFYVGRLWVRTTNETYAGAHEPIISEAVFKRAEDVRLGRLSARPKRHDFAYRRLIKCATCGRSLTGELKKRHVYYRCHSQTCRGTCIREDVVDDWVEETLKSLVFPPEIEDAVNAHLRRRNRVNAKETALERGRQAQEAKRQQERLDRLTDAYLDGDVERDTYLRRKAELLQVIGETKEERKAPESGHDLIEKFELTQALCSWDSAAPAPIKRAIFQFLSSNPKVKRKKLAFMRARGVAALARARDSSKCTHPGGWVRTIGKKARGSHWCMECVVLGLRRLDTSLLKSLKSLKS